MPVLMLIQNTHFIRFSKATQVYGRSHLQLYWENPVQWADAEARNLKGRVESLKLSEELRRSRLWNVPVQGFTRKSENMGLLLWKRSYFSCALSSVFFTLTILNFLIFFKSSISLFLPFPPLLLILANHLIPFLSHGWK